MKLYLYVNPCVCVSSARSAGEHSSLEHLSSLHVNVSYPPFYNFTLLTSFFKSQTDWKANNPKVEDFVGGGGALSLIPHANCHFLVNKSFIGSLRQEAPRRLT